MLDRSSAIAEMSNTGQLYGGAPTLAQAPRTTAMDEFIKRGISLENSIRCEINDLECFYFNMTGQSLDRDSTNVSEGQKLSGLVGLSVIYELLSIQLTRLGTIVSKIKEIA